MTHLDDGALIAILDSEEGQRASLEHLRDCVACRARLDALRARSERVTRGLAAAPAPVHPGYDADFVAAIAGAPAAPRSRPQRRWWLLAAGLAGLVLAASPAAAWLAAEIGELLAGGPWVTREMLTDTANPDATPRTDPTTVSAEIEGDGLIIRLVPDRVPMSLTLRATDEPLATARVAPAGAGGELTVHPDGFEIRTAPSATVEVAVPGSLAWVEVRVGSRVLSRQPASALAAGPWIVEPGR